MSEQRFLFVFKQKTAYEISTRDWSSDVCSSDLQALGSPRVPWHDSRTKRIVRIRRSEEHTSELQSRVDISYAVFCLKKTKCVSFGRAGTLATVSRARECTRLAP